MRHHGAVIDRPPSGPDASPEADESVGAGVTRRYVIASVPRSGSSLLTHLLWETGVAGAPNEYLNPLQRRAFDERFGPMPVEVYLERLQRFRTTGNGVFGLKIHRHHARRFVEAPGHDLADLLPDARWIATARRDRVAQAVSMEIAHQTRRWAHRPQPPRREATYDHHSISKRLDAINRQMAGWATWFDERGIVPLTVWYEDLVADPDAVLAEVLARIDPPGLSGSATERRDVRRPRPERQADHVNAEWIARFRAETSRSAEVRYRAGHGGR